MSDAFFQLAAATTGSLGFSLLFNVRGKKLVFSTFGGFLSWLAYLIFYCYFPDSAVCCLLASTTAGLYAEAAARWTKSPATVYFITAAVPLIPGSSLYRTMACAVNGDSSGFSGLAIQTILQASAIAAGILIVSTLFGTVKAIHFHSKKKSGR